MNYATIDDLAARFGDTELINLTDTLGDGVVNSEPVNRALADATAEMDGYLAVRYALPLPVVPEVLVRVSCDIARYLLWSSQASDEVRHRYEGARRLLEGLAAGKVTLGMPAVDTPAASVQASLASFVPGAERVFGRRMY
jgi:phage gp36-like protein